MLAEVWSSTVIDNQKWRSVLVYESQYLFQVVKYNDLACCKPMKSNIHQILTNHFLPAPVLFGKNDQGVFASSVQDQSAHFGSLLHRIALSSLVSFEFSSVSHMQKLWQLPLHYQIFG